MATVPGAGEGSISGLQERRGRAKTDAKEGGHRPPLDPGPLLGRGPFSQPGELPQDPNTSGAAAMAAIAGEAQETLVAAIVDGLVSQSAQLLAASAGSPEERGLAGALATLRAWLVWYLARLSRACQTYDVPTYGVVAHIYLSRLQKGSYRTAAPTLAWAPACAILTAIKMLEDEPMQDLHHARLGNFELGAFAREEAVFLQALEWRLEVHPDEFAAHSSALLAGSVARILRSGEAPALLAQGASLGLLPQKPEAAPNHPAEGGAKSAPRGERTPPAPPQGPAAKPFRHRAGRRAKKAQARHEEGGPRGPSGPKAAVTEPEAPAPGRSP